jgi:hypothetical protein
MRVKVLFYFSDINMNAAPLIVSECRVHGWDTALICLRK